MTKKISALLLCAVMIFSVFSLSSCYLLSDKVVGGLLTDSGGNTGGGGGDTNNITINGGAATGEVLAASKALLSSVSIVCKFYGYSNALFGQYGSYTHGGSGVIYKLDKTSGDAYIITNYHVVYDEGSSTSNKICSEISVLLYGKEHPDYVVSATYVGGSSQYDIAVLKVSGSKILAASAAEEAKFANSNDVAVLETVIAIGNAQGEGISATVGHVNVDSEQIDLDGDSQGIREFRVIRTDAAVNEGNSGGGLYNLNGDVVGIVNAKMIDSKVDNIGYAIPSNIAKAIADNIIFYCDGTREECPKRVIMGINITNTNLRTEYDTETGKVRLYENALVDSLEKNAPVKDVIKVGDIINSITVDGVKYEVTRTFHVVDAMLNARATSKVSMNITRGNHSIDVEIPISESMLVDCK